MGTNVMIFGTFDILHLGHIALFEEAKQYGDTLTVVVATDERVEHIKGARPVHSQDERMAMLRAMKAVDHVVAGEKENVYRVITDAQPDVIALGYDQHVFVDRLQETLTEQGLSETKVVRLSPFKPEKHKSGNIKRYVEKHI